MVKFTQGFAQLQKFHAQSHAQTQALNIWKKVPKLKGYDFFFFFFSFLTLDGKINKSHTNLSIQKFIFTSQSGIALCEKKMLGLFGHKPDMIP